MEWDEGLPECACNQQIGALASGWDNQTWQCTVDESPSKYPIRENRVSSLGGNNYCNQGRLTWSLELGGLNKSKHLASLWSPSPQSSTANENGIWKRKKYEVKEVPAIVTVHPINTAIYAIALYELQFLKGYISLISWNTVFWKLKKCTAE